LDVEFSPPILFCLIQFEMVGSFKAARWTMFYTTKNSNLQVLMHLNCLINRG